MVAAIVEVENVVESSVSADFETDSVTVRFTATKSTTTDPTTTTDSTGEQCEQTSYELAFVPAAPIVPSKCYTNVASLNVLLVLEKVSVCRSQGLFCFISLLYSFITLLLATITRTGNTWCGLACLA